MRLTRFVPLLLLILCSSFANAQTTDAIRQELDALKKEQEAIRRELQDLRRLIVAQQQQQQPSAPPPPPLPASVDISKEKSRGSQNARVAIIEYSDYQCPFCARYVTQTYPEIDKAYIQTGKVRYVFRDLPLNMHPHAFKAAEATHCSGEQGKYWEMHDRLFANQRLLAPEELTKHAEALGLKVPEFQQCLNSSRFAEDVKGDIMQADVAGINGTPSFLIGVIEPNSSKVRVTDRLVGARSFAEFQAAIDKAIATR